MRVRHVPRQMVLPLEGGRAVGAGELSLARVEGGHVLLEQLVLEEGLVAEWALKRLALATLVSQHVVAVTALRELFVAQAAVGGGPLVSTEVLVQVGLGFEHFQALDALVRSLLTMPISAVLF